MSSAASEVCVGFSRSFNALPRAELVHSHPAALPRSPQTLAEVRARADAGACRFPKLLYTVPTGQNPTGKPSLLLMLLPS